MQLQLRMQPLWLTAPVCQNMWLKTAGPVSQNVVRNATARTAALVVQNTVPVVQNAALVIQNASLAAQNVIFVVW